MAGLIGLKDKFDIAWANDPDADRHGIVTPSIGLMNPNHYLAVAIRYLLTHRPKWPAAAAVGKTLVSVESHRPRGRQPRPQAAAKCPSALNGSLRDFSTAPAASAARKARVPVSFAATARSGPPIRTA